MYSRIHIRVAKGELDNKGGKEEEEVNLRHMEHKNWTKNVWNVAAIWI